MSRTATCPQCSALVEMPPERLATTCPYCRTPLVASPSESLAQPDVAASFVLTREQAALRLAQYLRSRVWAPERVRRDIVPERIEGVLLPFWVHGGVARSQWNARIGVHYYRTVRRGGKTHRERETEWFDSAGTHVAQFEGHLVSASKGLSEVEANQLEPFDLGQARAYEPSLVAGWIAEFPTLSREQAEPVARAELHDAQHAAIQRFLPADAVSGLTNNTVLEEVTVRLALLPAWIAIHRSHGGVLRLLINGQTGEVVGKLPVSGVKVGLAIGLGLGIPAAIFLAARFL